MKTNEQQAIKAGIITITTNIALTIFKIIAGVVGNSTAMIADAMHSFSDLYTTAIVMIGIKLAGRKADKDHPYGHERFECVAAILLSAVLAFTGGAIGWMGIRQIISREYSGEMGVPGVIALVAAIVTLVVQGLQYLYKRNVAKRIESTALMADAWHHLSDALSSVGSFLGILGARMGFPILDPIAAIVICLVVLKVAVDVFREAISKMTDKACDAATEDEMRHIVMAHEAVAGVDVLRTRLFGDRIYVELEISVCAASSVGEAHDVAHEVHDAIEGAFTKVKHCAVHINPVVL